MVRWGGEFVFLEFDALTVFLAALTPRRPDELLAAARQAGAADPAGLVELLLGDGLLVALGGDDVADLAVLRKLRLQTVGVGVGNNTDDPRRFVISDNALEPLLTCDGLTYALWAASDGRSIGQVCTVLAAGYPMQSDEILRHLLAVLPQLLSAGVVFLDAAPGSRFHD